ncbi:MAG: hypothetical protein JWO06_3325 [Bacteroidota bacterium]|nr:hypothetical protein [Bacteroidota bacterium]
MKASGFKFLIAILLIFCSAISMAALPVRADKIFDDTSATPHIKIHHHFDAGIICRFGRENVRTRNDFDNTTSSTSNYPVVKGARFGAFRMGHGIVLKKNFEAGFTYGLDIYSQPYDTRAFVPLMMHGLKNIRLTKKLALVFTERAGYAFFLHSKNNDPFLKRAGVEGGFISETLLGLSVKAKHGNYFQVLTGYRFQHIHSKNIMYTDPSLTQLAGFSNLPEKITEVSDGLYHFIYLSLGVAF